MVLIGVIIGANGLSLISLAAVVCGGAIALLPKSSNLKSPSFKNDVESIPIVNSRSTEPESNRGANQTQVTHSRLYRQTEMRRIKASLLANGSILVVGDRRSHALFRHDASDFTCWCGVCGDALYGAWHA